MGTPEFSVPILKSIHNSKHNVIEVYTQPPKKKNRGQLVNLTPIHEFSNKNNISTKKSFRNKRSKKNFLLNRGDLLTLILGNFFFLYNFI